MLLLFVAAVVVGAANAATPCQAPSQLTFRASRHDWADTNFRRYYSEYDRDFQRFVMFEESFDGGHRELREFLFLHSTDSAYELDFHTRQCRHFRAGPFIPFGVPPNSTFEGEFELGGPNERVMVDRWSDRVPQRRETWIGEFSLNTCYPISQFLVDQVDFNRTSISHFYDVVAGIANPDDFNVPPECNHAPLLKEYTKGAKVARSLLYGHN